MGWMTINHIPCFAPPVHKHSNVYIYTYPTPSKNLGTWGIMATTLVFQVLWVLGGSDYIRICGYRYKRMHLINVYIYIYIFCNFINVYIYIYILYVYIYISFCIMYMCTA